MIEAGIVRSTCELCNEGCGVLIHMSGGKPVRVEGDPDNPVNRGAVCRKCRASIDILYSPARLKYPLKRKGARGEGSWERITWDEALDTAAWELKRLKETHGPESVVFIRGGAQGHQDSYMARFANVFGSPNIASMAPICHVPRHLASVLTYGFMAHPDYENPPACTVLWGVNPAHTSIGEAKRANAAVRKGSRLIVIDPWESEFARKADLWLKPRPATDLALALGMIHVIIKEGLYDREFVEKWTTGFNALQDHVTDYPPEKVSEITWVPPDTIKAAARLYATTAPAAIAWGNGIDNNRNNFQSARAIAILRAVTGNIGRPGGDLNWTPSGVVSKGDPDFNQQSALSNDVREKRLSANQGLLPMAYYTLPQDIVRAVRTGKPYPIKAALLQGGNLLHTYSHAKETYEAMSNLNFTAMMNSFMTPTTQLADLVLPLSTYLEIDGMHESEHVPVASVIQKVAEIGECRSVYEIYRDLAGRMELRKYFSEDEYGMLDYLLRPAGLTFQEFRKLGFLSGRKQYRDYEKDGFHTDSGKVEIYSRKLKEWGFDPLPVYYEPVESPLSDPELAEEYPLVFTNRKWAYFHHSAGREIPDLRKRHPDPIVYINAATGENLGIEEGDWVYIETKRGRIRQKASLNPKIHPSVIIADHGWWYPERPAHDDIHGWSESNINVLTDNKPPFAREMGSATLRGVLCRVSRVNE